MINGLEATALGIFTFESGLKPGSRAVRNCNPGNLRLPGYPSDSGGYTVFPDFATGFAALVRDLRAKFTGQNEHKLGAGSTLLELMEVYAPASDQNEPLVYAHFLASYVGQAIGKVLTTDSQLQTVWCSPTDLESQ